MTRRNLLSRFLLFFAAVATAAALTGCADQKQSGLDGKWAYVHDPETTILKIRGDRATYKNRSYDYSADGKYITLTSGDEVLKLRYIRDEDGFYLYEPAKYEYALEGDPDGIVGAWYDQDTQWTFEFTDEGTFREDGYFPGYYTVNDSDHSIKLVYEDHFYDTTLYYSLDGDTLYVEYPWSMVRAE